MPQLWRVVGGADKGGIVVREGEALTSTQASERLAHGSLVEQLELRNAKRLHFRRLEGSGPLEGWVSLELQGKALVERAVDLPQQPGGQSWTDDGSAVLARYKGGQLDKLIDEFHTVLRTMPFGRFPVEQPDPRVGGVGTPWDRWTTFADAEGKPRLLLTGDSITHGPPMCTGAPWTQAVAERNPGLSVENSGWGGIMSMSLARPGDFKGGDWPLPVPPPGAFACNFVSVLIGTNDAMAIAGIEEWTDQAYAMPIPGSGGPCRLPQDWRTSCRPSEALFEESLGELVRAFKESGARVSVATLPMLGEDLTDGFNEKQKLRKSPYLTCQALAQAVRRVCASEGASVLPLFECMEARVRKLERPPNKWTPMSFGGRMASCGMLQQKAVEQAGLPLPWEDLGLEKTRPEFMFDLVHFNERGGALHAALVQEWLEAQLQAQLAET